MPTPRIRRPRLTYANVASTLALALALSMGGAYAAEKVGSNQIKKNAVKSKHIANGQVKTADLRNGAVKTAKVRDGAVTSSKVLDGTLQGSDFAPRAAGVAMAGVTVTGAGAVANSFNRVGGAITVSQSSVGTYAVTIPGTSFANFTDPLISLTAAYDGYCYLNQAVSPTTVQIRCRDFTDTLQNSTFRLIVFKDNNGASARVMPGKRAADAP